LELDEKRADTWYKLAALQRKQGNFPEAEKSYLKAIELDPEPARALYNLGCLYRDWGKPPEAREYFKQAGELGSPDAWYNLGNFELARKNSEEAVRLYNLAIELKPDFPPAYINRSLAFVNQRQYEEAEESVLEGIRLNPDFGAFYNTLGAIYDTNNEKFVFLRKFWQPVA